MTFNIGVIGTGAIGQEHMRRISNTLKGGCVVAVNDINLAQAQEVASSLGLDAKVYASAKELIHAADVHAILVTSWGPTHEEFVLEAIAAGKPVFCEKPLAVTAEGCKNIVDAEIKAGRRLVQVGFMRPYDAGYRALKNVITSAQIGTPLIVHCAHRNPSVGEGYTTPMAITDTMVHEIDVLRWLLDDDYASVQVVYPRKTSAASSHLADPQIVLLETVKGVRIDVEIFVNCKYGYDIQCEVVGESGVARLPEPMTIPLRSNAFKGQAILTDWKQRFIDAYDVELQAFLDTLASGRFTGPSAWDGYAAAITADACVVAQQSGGIVPIAMPARPAFY